ncbi:hypothetical protein CRYUN_Cryun15aG0091100 [Craigia yunnanensis]
MAICCFIYSFIYCTDAIDRERARVQALIESEMQQPEETNSTSSGKQSEFHVENLKELDDKEKSEVYIEIGGEESLDFDDNDEKSLLNRHQLDSQT